MGLRIVLFFTDVSRETGQFFETAPYCVPYVSIIPLQVTLYKGHDRFSNDTVAETIEVRVKGSDLILHVNRGEQVGMNFAGYPGKPESPARIRLVPALKIQREGI